MQNSLKSFFIFILVMASALFFSNMAIAEGDTSPPASIPPTGDSASSNAPMTNTDREPLETSSNIGTTAPSADTSPAPNAPAATTSDAESTHRPANVSNNQIPLTIDNITVTSARAKPSMAGSTNSAAFVSLHNANKAELVIVGAMALSSDKPNASSIANRVEMHNVTTDSNGVSQMTQVNKLVIPVNGDLIMEPGAIHIMLLDLKKALKEGDTIFINLVIQGLGTYQVPVPVKSQ